MNTKPALTAKSMANSPNLLFEGPFTLSDSSNYTIALLSINHNDCSNWIIDLSATDHMTYDEKDVIITFILKHSCIANANRVTYSVTKVGIIVVSPFISLSITLLVSSLSNKL